jgi:phosphate-selective porin OprO and OprP
VSRHIKRSGLEPAPDHSCPRPRKCNCVKRCGIFTATAIVAAILAGGPAAAQDSASARLEALKAEINELRNEVEALKGDVAEGREEARGATGQMAAAKTEPPADAPSIRVSSSNQPTICSVELHLKLTHLG